MVSRPSRLASQRALRAAARNSSGLSSPSEWLRLRTTGASSEEATTCGTRFPEGEDRVLSNPARVSALLALMRSSSARTSAYGVLLGDLQSRLSLETLIFIGAFPFCNAAARRPSLLARDRSARVCRRGSSPSSATMRSFDTSSKVVVKRPSTAALPNASRAQSRSRSMLPTPEVLRCIASSSTSEGSNLASFCMELGSPSSPKVFWGASGGPEGTSGGPEGSSLLPITFCKEFGKRPSLHAFRRETFAMLRIVSRFSPAGSPGDIRMVASHRP
mmetsp:Transcript_43772/g.95279  ORF Transcript_43772/g.95279 Transcript_43772/m.95279 type:complete len:274 (+) Transcript_43772:625-1446(+)